MICDLTANSSTNTDQKHRALSRTQDSDSPPHQESTGENDDKPDRRLDELGVLAAVLVCDHVEVLSPVLSGQGKGHMLAKRPKKTYAAGERERVKTNALLYTLMTCLANSQPEALATVFLPLISGWVIPKGAPIYAARCGSFGGFNEGRCRPHQLKSRQSATLTTKAEMTRRKSRLLYQAYGCVRP